MKFVFVDKSNKEVEIITNILDSWSVRYKVLQRKIPHGFVYYLVNDVEIDVEPAFYEYLSKEIDTKLNALENLENSYNLPDYETNEQKKNIQKNAPKSKKANRQQEKSKESSSLFVDLFNELQQTKNSLNDRISENNEVINFLKQFVPKSETKKVSWESLPEEVRQELLTQAPESVLRSKNTTIIETQNGYIIDVQKTENPDKFE